MVIVSAKISKRKLLWGLIAAVAIIVLLAVLVGQSNEPARLADTGETARTLDGGTNEERIDFLKSYGWEVETEPKQTQEVRIPQEFNEVFTRYNQMQQEQGFDLSEYAGKTAKRYVYTVTNHPDGEHYQATVLVYKNQIIGGDVTSSTRGGSMHGFEKPD